MKYFSILGLLLIACLLGGCSNDTPLEPKADDFISSDHSKNDRSIMAIELANYAVNSISDSKTRAERSVQNVSSIKLPRTKSISALPDSILYLVNFADKKGFAIVSLDYRLCPVYAVSDRGNLNLSDTLYNKGLSLVLNGIFDNIAHTLSSTTRGNGLLPDVPITPGYDLIAKVSPLIPEVVRNNWNQHYPFNSLCPKISFSPYVSPKSALAGCTAIAASTIMSYHKWPTSYKSYNFNWNSMISSTGNSDLYQLISLLGDSENLQITYGLSDSPASPSYFKRTFENFRYKTDTYSGNQTVTKFDSTVAHTSINGKKPFIINGYTQDYTAGHTWVIDGSVTYKTNKDSQLDGTYIFTYWHCVWGWPDGEANGYYNIDASIGVKPQAMEKDPTDLDSAPSIEWNFVNLTMLTGITPNK